MTKQVDIQEAKRHLSRLRDEVAGGGGDVVIAKAGMPVALLTRLNPGRSPRKPGFLKGRIVVPADFDRPLPGTVLDAFEGEP